MRLNDPVVKYILCVKKRDSLKRNTFKLEIFKNYSSIDFI